MARVTWTDQALDDLHAACLFLARDAPRYAQLFAIQAFQAADHLTEFPRLGRVVPELGRNEIREVFVGRYRIIYRLLENEVDILTLHHGVRPLESLDPPDTSSVNGWVSVSAILRSGASHCAPRPWLTPNLSPEYNEANSPDPSGL